MKSHLDHLLESFPLISSEPVLDLGAGRGSFLIDAAKRGFNAKGVEYKPEYIEIAKKRANQEGVSIDIIQGRGESLPFKDEEFGFMNLCEVIEHVEDPKAVLQEVYRMLKKGGEAYMSVPNRFGLRDQHFHLYFVNWLPRRLSHGFISLFGKHKGYDGSAGLQRLSEMHYYTFKRIKKLAEGLGFQVTDIREGKARARWIRSWPLVLPLYRFARFCVLDSFHLKLRKN